MGVGGPGCGRQCRCALGGKNDAIPRTDHVDLGRPRRPVGGEGRAVTGPGAGAGCEPAIERHHGLLDHQRSREVVDRVREIQPRRVEVLPGDALLAERGPERADRVGGAGEAGVDPERREDGAPGGEPSRVCLIERGAGGAVGHGTRAGVFEGAAQCERWLLGVGGRGERDQGGGHRPSGRALSV